MIHKLPDKSRLLELKNQQRYKRIAQQWRDSREVGENRTRGEKREFLQSRQDRGGPTEQKQKYRFDKQQLTSNNQKLTDGIYTSTSKNPTLMK